MSTLAIEYLLPVVLNKFNNYTYLSSKKQIINKNKLFNTAYVIEELKKLKSELDDCSIKYKQINDTDLELIYTDNTKA